MTNRPQATIRSRDSTMNNRLGHALLVELHVLKSLCQLMCWGSPIWSDSCMPCILADPPACTHEPSWEVAVTRDKGTCRGGGEDIWRALSWCPKDVQCMERAEEVRCKRRASRDAKGLAHGHWLVEAKLAQSPCGHEILYR